MALGACRRERDALSVDRRRLLVATLGLVAGACAPVAEPSQVAPSRQPLSSGPRSPLAAHPGRGIWPDVYRRAPPEVREAYAYAAGNWATLRYIPCYCGCGSSAGHRDNFDCYVSESRVDGWVVLDTHGFG